MNNSVRASGVGLENRGEKCSQGMHQVSHLEQKLPQIRKHEIPGQSMTDDLDIWLGDWKEKNKMKRTKQQKQKNKTKKSLAEMYRQKCRQRQEL